MAKQKQQPSKRRKNSAVPLEDYEGQHTGRGSARQSKGQQKVQGAQERADERWNRQPAKPLVCINDAQKAYLAQIIANDITFGIGPAGTGKTYVCMKHAAEGLDNRQYKKIIVVRPIIEVGESIGYLKGDVEEKTAPYQVPFLEVLEQHYGKSHVENMRFGPHPKIEFVAPGFIRGRTFRDALIVLDEAQNMTFDQMITFVTRLGDNSKVVINGDPLQVDIKDKQGRSLSGLPAIVELLDGLDEVGITEFTEEDIVRHGLVKKILLRYRAKRALELKASEVAAKPKAPAKTARKKSDGQAKSKSAS